MRPVGWPLNAARDDAPSAVFRVLVSSCMTHASHAERKGFASAPAEASASTSGEYVPFEGFRYVQSWATNQVPGGWSASFDSVVASGAGALVGSAALTATITAWRASRTAAERDLPAGTHWRAAGVGVKALTAASVLTGTVTALVLCGAYALGIDSVETLRSSLRGGTRAAIAASGADTLRNGRRDGRTT